MDQVITFRETRSTEQIAAYGDIRSQYAELSIKMEHCGLGFLFSEPLLKIEAAVRLF